MKINSQNYYQEIEKMGISSLSPAMKKAHELIDKATHAGTDWKAYQTYKKAFDLQFEALELLRSKPKANTGAKQAERKIEKNEPLPNKPSQRRINPIQEEAYPTREVQSKMDKSKIKGRAVELISPEVAFIKRFASIQYKTKTNSQILAFVRALQKAIVERKIRKTSKYARQIEDMQEKLVHAVRSGKEEIMFRAPFKELEKLLKIAGAEYLLPSVRLIKAYISLQGKDITKQKANNLLERIQVSKEKRIITSEDRYYKQIRLIEGSIKKFVDSKQPKGGLDISEAELNGLEGLLANCGCKQEGAKFTESDYGPLAGFENDKPQRTIINSLDVIKLKSNKIGFSGKWLTFIGNPSKGFTMMIYGKPKFGKSILATELAGYLARNHGKVLFVAIEEGFEDTLKERLDAPDIAHENLDVSDYMPNPIAKEYEFIFIDSVNRAGLSAKDLDELEHKYPGKSFVYVFQTTKDGNFKGAMEFKHNADVIIEVPELGYATQYGRYNQGGDLKIFD